MIRRYNYILAHYKLIRSTKWMSSRGNFVERLWH